MKLNLENKKVVILGGSAGVGLAVAKAVAASGGKAAITGRSESKLNQAKAEIGGEVETYSMDVTDEKSVKNLFENIEPFDALVVTASQTISGPFLELDTAQARQVMENKFWGQYYAAKYGAGKLKEGGSITLFSGSIVEKPIANLSAFAAANGAVEALARSLAVELGPIRVNVISPGLIASSAYDGMPAEQRENYFNSVANALPVKRIAQPEDIAETVLYLIQNKFTTGAVINVDGGVRLI